MKYFLEGFKVFHVVLIKDKSSQVINSSVLKATIVALRKIREVMIVALMALRVLLIQMHIFC